METLKYTVLILGVILIAGILPGLAQAKPEPRPARDDYAAVWAWCENRFPGREDLQEACRWGAYEMLPGQDVPAEERTQDA